MTPAENKTEQVEADSETPSAKKPKKFTRQKSSTSLGGGSDEEDKDKAKKEATEISNFLKKLARHRQLMSTAMCDATTILNNAETVQSWKKVAGGAGGEDLKQADSNGTYQLNIYI